MDDSDIYSNIIAEAAKYVIAVGNTEDIEAMTGLAEKCKKCFHYS